MAARYTTVKVNISDGQKAKLKNSLGTKNFKTVSIRLAYEDLNGEDGIALTQGQLNSYIKAVEEKKGITIKMTKAQVIYNMQVEGGFFPALAAALPFVITAAKTILPALATGAHSGLASTGVSKLLDSGAGVAAGGAGVNDGIGAGLYLKKGGCVCQVETDGSGLYLSPQQNIKGSSIEHLPDGYYIKKKCGNIIDGRGLILGPDSPFKNIPLLGMIL